MVHLSKELTEGRNTVQDHLPEMKHDLKPFHQLKRFGLSALAWHDFPNGPIPCNVNKYHIPNKYLLPGILFAFTAN